MTAHFGKLPQDIYDESLKIIGNVYFSRREIDIIACLLSGRTAKTIASLLSIAPRTVETHSRNIVLKLEKNSREDIRNFIEKSGKFSVIKNYYISLFLQCAFEERLRAVAAKNKSPLTCLILYRHQQDQKNKPSLISQMEKHLKVVGIRPLIEALQDFSLIFSVNHNKSYQPDYRICILDEDFLDRLRDNNSQEKAVISCLSLKTRDAGAVLFLLPTSEKAISIPHEITEVGYIACGDQENYYDLFFKVLKRILPLVELNEIISNFKEEHHIILGSDKRDSSVLEEEEKNSPLGKAVFPDKSTVSINDSMEKQQKNFLKHADTEHNFSLNENEGHDISLQKYFSFLIKIYSYKKILTKLVVNFFQRFLIKGIASAIISCVFLLVLGSGYFTQKEFPAKAKTHNISKEALARSDMVIPQGDAFLNRPQLIKKIDSSFKSAKDIQTLALVGIGGSGKTILSHQYARSQNIPIVWKINGETKETLINSFRKLAYTLSKTPEEKQVLKEVQDIKDANEREERLLQVVKQHLKLQPKWFLIYDNVESFRDLQKYFPFDPNAWGQGKVIITTRNGHIQNNSHINHVLWVGELNETEKLSLFVGIMNQGSASSLSLAHKKEARKFLEIIPPFPLDVSIAAYYLKATHTPYVKYEEDLKEYDKDFTEIQENILKESGNYSRTRYHIITLTLKKLIAINKEFGDLLLLICLLDAHDIPRDLLDNYKGLPTTDKFIYYLKKYSLVANSLSSSATLVSHLTIHRSTQDIGFSYLTEFLKLNKDNILSKKISDALVDYLAQAIEDEDFSKMQLMVSHAERFLQHRNLLTDFSRDMLTKKLGCIYYFLGNKKTLQVIRDSLNNFTIESSNALSSEDKFRVARSFLHIGFVFTELRCYDEAQKLLEKAMLLYVELRSGREISWVLSHLGNLHRRQGNYEKAKYYLEESIHYNKIHGIEDKRYAQTLTCLGSVYRGLGSYQKSIKILEESLILCQKYYFANHFSVGRVLTSLGNVYRKLGDYKKAKEYLEDGLLIFKKHFSENHISLGLALAYLGNCLRELGDYQKSEDYLEQSLRIHQKNFDENHERMGWILFHLASTYKALGKNKESQVLFDRVLKIYANHCGGENIETARLLRDMAEIYLKENRLEDAENLINKSLKILQNHKHLEAYMSFETLGEIYIKKSIQLSYTTSSQNGQNFKNQALNQFNQALKIIEKIFPKNSDHIRRINCKVNNIQ